MECIYSEPAGYQWIDHSELEPGLHRASTGRWDRLEALIWERQAAAVTGSGMSGGEIGSRQECNIQKCTHVAQIHTPAHKYTHLHTD